MPTPPRGSLSPELLDAAVELMGRTGRGGTVRVIGRSMEPTLREGQAVALEFCPGSLGRGDLLVFRQAGYLVVHRYLGTARPRGEPPYHRTRGDGVASLDPRVELDRVVGRVIAVEEPGGWISVRGRRARLYGWVVAWHDRLWALATHLGRRTDGWLARGGLPSGLAGLSAAWDRRLLRLSHRLLHARVHRRVARPPEAGGPDLGEDRPLL